VTALEPAPRRVFAAWFGGAPMSANRAAGVASLSRTGVEVVLVTEADMGAWILPGHPVHPGWPLLTPIQQADYLRCYLLHHHGGGYTDIKPVTASWEPSFDQLEHHRWLGVGYPEIGRHGVAQLGLDVARGRYQPFDGRWWHYRWLQLNHRRLLGNGAFIFRPRSAFTSRWYDELHRRMDALLPELRRHPARHPKERAGQVYDGEVSQYPSTWTHLAGDIFHPLCLRYHRRLGRVLPPPSFVDYQ
jgi:hypothetical protein